MMGMSPWLGRLLLLLALITIDHASPPLAITLVIGAGGAAIAVFLYRGSTSRGSSWTFWIGSPTRPVCNRLMKSEARA